VDEVDVRDDGCCMRYECDSYITVIVKT